MSRIKALFLDRDGVINIDTKHLYKYEDVVYVDGIFELIKYFSKHGFKVFVVTNQAGIAKGYYKKHHVEYLHQKLHHYIYKKTNVEITEWVFCPHSQDDQCGCRKPKPGLFNYLIDKYSISKKNSLMIGDKISDMKAASLAGINRCYILESEYFEKRELEENYSFINNLKEVYEQK